MQLELIREAYEYAVDKAISEMPETFLIRRLLLENKAEVKDMLLTEYDEVTHMRHVREEGREEGRLEQRTQDEQEFSERMLETIKNVMESMSLSPEEVMEAMKIPESDRDKYLAEIHSTAG